MIHLIANKIIDELEALTWIECMTGVVKPARLFVNDVVKTLPVAYNTNVTTCSQSELLAFVPDSSKRAILYFEDFGTTLDRMENQAMYFTSRLRLVCWLNYHKICPDMNEPSLVALNILEVIPSDLGNFDNLIGVYVSVNGQLPNDAAVFARYSYQEERTQYLTYPYDYLAFDLSAQYMVRAGCAGEITICDPVC